MEELLYNRKIENILCFSDSKKEHLFHILLIMYHHRLP